VLKAFMKESFESVTVT